MDVVAVYIARHRRAELDLQDMEEQNNYTYILTCADGTLYCGWTNHLEQRVKAHNEGRGAKYTKARRPVVLSYWEAFETKEEAMRREYAIKRLTRSEKLRLIGIGEGESGQAPGRTDQNKGHSKRLCGSKKL